MEEEKKEDKPKRKGTGGGRPKKPEGVEKKNLRITFLVKQSFWLKMEADMAKKGFVDEKSAYVISAIEEYMKK